MASPSTALVAGIVVAVLLVILLFPDGVPRLRVWMWVVVGFVSLAAISLACELVFAATALSDHHVNGNTVNNGPGGGLLLNQPRGTHWLTIVPAAFETAAALLLVASVIHQASCYRGMHGERRQQLRWLMSGEIVCVVAIALLPTAKPRRLAALTSLVAGALDRLRRPPGEH